MRRLSVGFAVATLVCAVAGAGPVVAQVPEDSVVGAGVLGTGLSFTIDAHSGPSGEQPTGTAEAATPPEQGGLRVGGRLTCLTVTGNRAVIGVDNSLGDQGLFSGALFEVTDGEVDTLGLNVFIQDVPTVCPSTLGIGLGTVLSGNIIVTDAQPFPTSKDECKNGGWRGFGVFNNQGDCISFVATGG